MTQAFVKNSPLDHRLKMVELVDAPEGSAASHVATIKLEGVKPHPNGQYTVAATFVAKDEQGKQRLLAALGEDSVIHESMPPSPVSFSIVGGEKVLKALEDLEIPVTNIASHFASLRESSQSLMPRHV